MVIGADNWTMEIPVSSYKLGNVGTICTALGLGDVRVLIKRKTPHEDPYI